jgi:hypothetical protein
MSASSGLWNPLRGKALDKMAKGYGFKRKRYFWIFKESDRSLRERMYRYLRKPNGKD